MSEQTEVAIETSEPKPKRKYTRRKRRTVPRPRVEQAFEAPDEFAGLTETQCCNDCGANLAAAQQARRRMDELEMAYQRLPSRDPKSETVMEGDAEWLQRNPTIAEEWRSLAKTAMGRCAISGAPGCAHPLKGGLSPRMQQNPQAVARFQKVKKLLEHRKIDLRGAA